MMTHIYRIRATNRKRGDPIGGERERAQFLALAPYRAEYSTGVDILPVNFMS